MPNICWMTTKGNKIDNHRYADDTVLLAENEQELDLVDQVKRNSKDCGLDVNINQIETIISNEKERATTGTAMLVTSIEA